VDVVKIVEVAKAKAREEGIGTPAGVYARVCFSNGASDIT